MRTAWAAIRTINPLGFTLENYDAIGRWRMEDNQKPINTVSDLSTEEGETIHLTGARDIAKFAVENANGQRAFIHNLFHHTVKQAVGAYGPDAMEDLRQSFIKSGFNIRKLLAEIATVAASKGLPDTGNSSNDEGCSESFHSRTASATLAKTAL